VTVLGFPGMTRPGLLDALNRLDFGYRWVTRFLPLDKAQATRALTRLRRQWFAKRKSITVLPAVLRIILPAVHTPIFVARSSLPDLRCPIFVARSSLDV
jgi:type IV secretion system protein VirB4